MTAFINSDEVSSFSCSVRPFPLSMLVVHDHSLLNLWVVKKLVEFGFPWPITICFIFLIFFGVMKVDWPYKLLDGESLLAAINPVRGMKNSNSPKSSFTLFVLWGKTYLWMCFIIIFLVHLFTLRLSEAHFLLMFYSYSSIFLILLSYTILLLDKEAMLTIRNRISPGLVVL